MKNIKGIYWRLSGVFVLATIIVFILIESNTIDKEVTGVILSGVAIIISIIAMGLSDKKLKKFEGKIKIKSVLRRGDSNSDDPMYQVTFTIINNGEDPVNDFIYKIRFPKRFIFENEKNLHARSYISGYSKYIVDDSFGFLPAKNEAENSIPMTLKIPLKSWNKDNIWITVSGSNVSPSTFIVYPSDAGEILKTDDLYISVKNK
jgi:hypothetical protein